MAELDWLQYWFMFPVAVGVATTAMLSGIGGAALFIPIFVVIFPLLGPDYPLATAAAIGAALLTQAFGFLSGFIAYYRKKLIDFRSALPFLLIAVPSALAGAFALAALQQEDRLLKSAYALLMLLLCPLILRRTPPQADAVPGSAGAAGGGARPIRQITGHDGRSYQYPAPRVGLFGAMATTLGGFITGLLGVGIGEVVMPQLVKRNRVPVAVAAATSVFTVIITIVAASFTQISALTAAGGINAIPWHLVVYTVPAVIIGGQIGPRLQGTIAQRTMEQAIAILFGIIGLAMAFIVLRQLSAQ